MWLFSQCSSVNCAKCSHWCFWRLIWHVWHIPWIWSCGAGMKLPVGGWGMSSWPPVEAEWRYSTVAPAFLPPGLASSGWTHRRWLPAGHSEWRGDSSCPKLPATGKKKNNKQREEGSHIMLNEADEELEVCFGWVEVCDFELRLTFCHVLHKYVVRIWYIVCVGSARLNQYNLTSTLFSQS